MKRLVPRARAPRMLLSAAMLLVAGSLLRAPTASAQTASALQSNSDLELKIGPFPSFVVAPKSGSTVALSNVGASHSVGITSEMFSTVGNALGSTLFTGYPLVTNLVATFHVPSATFSPGFSTPDPVGGSLGPPNSTPMSGTLCPGGCIGGFGGLTGSLMIELISPAPSAILDLGIIGGGGTTTVTVPPGIATIQATGGPWISGRARITGIETNVISLPTQGGQTGNAFTLDPDSTVAVKTFTVGMNYLTTMPSASALTASYVSISGTNALVSSMQPGSITLVTPARIDFDQLLPVGAALLPGGASARSSLLGQAALPVRASLELHLAPEPVLPLLLVAGAGALVLMARRRSR